MTALAPKYDPPMPMEISTSELSRICAASVLIVLTSSGLTILAGSTQPKKIRAKPPTLRHFLVRQVNVVLK